MTLSRANPLVTCGGVCRVCSVPEMRRRHFWDSALSLSLRRHLALWSVCWEHGSCRSGIFILISFLCRPIILSVFVPFFSFFPHADVTESVSKNCSLITFPMAASPDRRVNLAVARIIPPILLGIVIYACYAVTKQLCSKSLLLLRDFPENVWLIASLKK